jgi:hypothetical protein
LCNLSLEREEEIRLFYAVNVYSYRFFFFSITILSFQYMAAIRVKQNSL